MAVQPRSEQLLVGDRHVPKEVVYLVSCITDSLAMSPAPLHLISIHIRPRRQQRIQALMHVTSLLGPHMRYPRLELRALPT